MKKIALFVVVIIGSVFLWNYAKPEKIQKTIENIGNQVAQKPVTPQKEEKKYIFVPYWTFTKEILDEDASLIYFGLGVNSSGIDEDDDGFKKLPSFNKLTSDKSERILAVRMTDKNINAAILKEVSVQQDIASSSVELAEKYRFDGVMLDYETSAFGFDTTTNNIFSFINRFGDEVKKFGLKYYTTLYGDTYFRARPYNVAKIGKIADGIFIMAYDFSKSRGNPGPNFPLIDNSVYGYDFEKMVDDFQKDVDNSKIVVTIGYFGYDWRIDTDGNAVAAGVPLSTNEIEQEFLDNCQYKNCVLNRTPKSFEPSITYTDDAGENHLIWYEDMQSAESKLNFLKTKGILQTASWAYSYY